MLNIVCVHTGTKYAPAYVTVLQDMVARNLATEHRFWCLTDAPADLPEGVTAIQAFEGLPGWWQKVALFSEHMPWAEGERVLYLDLDVVITGRLEELAETKGIIRDWNLPGYNSSVMVWDHGEHSDAWAKFAASTAMERLPGDQDWLTEIGGWDLLPRDWCVSYRGSALDGPPSGAKVICFHGEPKPHQVTGWVENVWKVGGDYVLPTFDGMNVSFDHALANVEANCKRDLPWFIGIPRKGQSEAVVICGGPSLKDSIDSIKFRQRRGAVVISVNNTLAFLTDNGIIPDAHVMLDARPENAAFIADVPSKTTLFLASQCAPEVFDAAPADRTVVWHNAFCDELRDVLEPYDKTHPIVFVPGGGTVGLRTLNLCWISGFKRIHVYGMDSSYAEDDHHAYPQALNDDDRTLTLRMGERTYRASIWMARQAEEFKVAWDWLTGKGIKLFVHGSGLIPDIAQQLRNG